MEARNCLIAGYWHSLHCRRITLRSPAEIGQPGGQSIGGTPAVAGLRRCQTGQGLGAVGSGPAGRGEALIGDEPARRLLPALQLAGRYEYERTSLTAYARLGALLMEALLREASDDRGREGRVLQLTPAQDGRRRREHQRDRP